MALVCKVWSVWLVGAPDTPTRSRKGGGRGRGAKGGQPRERATHPLVQQTPTMPRHFRSGGRLSPLLGWIVKRDYEKAAGLNRIQSEAEFLLVTPIRTRERLGASLLGWTAGISCVLRGAAELSMETLRVSTRRDGTVCGLMFPHSEP